MLRIATRASALARWQAERVGARLGVLLDEPVEFVLITTTGDRDQRPDLHSIGGTGVFVKEVQQAVLDDRADLAVHSAKDLPSETPAGLRLAAVPERGDPRDALVGSRLEEIPTGGRVGTGSVRRRAQLAAARPDLVFAPLRGNMETRLRKRVEDGHDAIVVAVAALDRLGDAPAGRAGRARGRVPRRRRQGARGARRDRRPGCAFRSAGRAGVSRRARWRVQPSVRRARARRRRVRPGRARSTTRGARWSRLAAHARRRIGNDAEAVGAAAARDLLDAKGGRDLLDGGGR